MRLADSPRTWGRTAAPTSLGPRSACGCAAGGGMHADELAEWLYGPMPTAPSLDDMASVFGLSFDALETGTHDAGMLPPRRLRLTLVVLRDAFPDDGAIRRWLRTPDATRGGERPLDLLLRGRVAQLELLAVREWNSRHPAGGGQRPTGGA